LAEDKAERTRLRSTVTDENMAFASSSNETHIDCSMDIIAVLIEAIQSGIRIIP
jgi:hypothetical protein